MKRAAAITFVALFGVGLLPSGATATETFPGDNGKIVFVRQGDVWVMGKRGRNETRLTNTKVRETAPTVSPDGKRIAFTRMRGRFRAAIFTMRMDGTHLKRLTGFATRTSDRGFRPTERRSSTHGRRGRTLPRCGSWIARRDPSSMAKSTYRVRSQAVSTVKKSTARAP